MRNAAPRQARRLNCFSHKKGKRRAFDRSTAGVAYQGDALGSHRFECGNERGMRRYGKLDTGLLLNNSDHSVRKIGPPHFYNVTCTLSGIEQQCKCVPFARSRRPSLLESRQLIVRPGMTRPRTIGFSPDTGLSSRNSVSTACCISRRSTARVIFAMAGLEAPISSIILRASLRLASRTKRCP